MLIRIIIQLRQITIQQIITLSWTNKAIIATNCILGLKTDARSHRHASLNEKRRALSRQVRDFWERPCVALGALCIFFFLINSKRC